MIGNDGHASTSQGRSGRSRQGEDSSFSDSETRKCYWQIYTEESNKIVVLVYSAKILSIEVK